MTVARRSAVTERIVCVHHVTAGIADWHVFVKSVDDCRVRQRSAHLADALEAEINDMVEMDYVWANLQEKVAEVIRYEELVWLAEEEVIKILGKEQKLAWVAVIAQEGCSRMRVVVAVMRAAEEPGLELAGGPHSVKEFVGESFRPPRYLLRMPVGDIQHFGH
jgi:hypothetical protein